MKKIFRNSIHIDGRSHDCLVCEIGNIRNGGKKAKITYEAYNAVEKCTTEFFDGNQWNKIASMLDMGVLPETSAYNIWNPTRRKRRADDLMTQAIAMSSAIIEEAP